MPHNLTLTKYTFKTLCGLIMLHKNGILNEKLITILLFKPKIIVYQNVSCNNKFTFIFSSLKESIDTNNNSSARNYLYIKL